MQKFYYSSNIIQRLFWMPLRLFFSFFLQLEVFGAENLKQKKYKVIFASNHISELDPLLIVSQMPFLSNFLPIIFVSMENKFYQHKRFNFIKRFIYGGLAFNLIGALQANSGHKDYKISLNNHLNALMQNRSVCIFPTGRMTSKINLDDARGGVIYLAEESKAKIIPVKIVSTGNTGLRSMFTFNAKFKIFFGNEINVEDLQIDTRTHQANHFKGKSVSLLKIIDNLDNFVSEV